MLRRSRNVVRAAPLAAWVNDSSHPPVTANVSVRLEGIDPRLVVVPRLWIERPGSVTPANPTGVTWSMYSVGEDSQGGIVILRAVDGATSRVIGPNATPGADGVAPLGDNLEIAAATDLLLVVRCSAVTAASIPGQTLWFAVDAFPADVSLSPEDYDGLIQGVKAQFASAVRVQG